MRRKIPHTAPAQRPTGDSRQNDFLAAVVIRQPLAASRKLFCNCPVVLPTRRYDAEVITRLRRLPATDGDDPPATQEYDELTDVVYRVNRESSCRYELGELPPGPLNEEALHLALRASFLLNCRPAQEIRFALRPVNDGSALAGFQRTALVGVHGFIPFGPTRLPIEQITLGEDTCRKIVETGRRRVFYIDRMGVPEIEVTTGAVLTSPAEVAQAMELLRNSLAAAGVARREPSALRGDIRLAVRGANFVTIRAFPSAKKIPHIIYHEVERQLALLQLRDRLKKLGVKKTSLRGASVDISDIITAAPASLPARAVLAGGRAVAVVVKNARAVMTTPLGSGRIFADELKQRVKAEARLDADAFFWTLVEAGRALGPSLLRATLKRAQVSRKDAVIFIWGPPAEVTLASEQIINRTKDAFAGVPAETRKALPDGTTAYVRTAPHNPVISPAAVPGYGLTDAEIYNARISVGEPFWERVRRYRALGVPENCVLKLAASPWAGTFDILINKYGAPVKFTAYTLAHKIKNWERRAPNKIRPGDIERTFSLWRQGVITTEGVLAALDAYVAGDKPLRQVLNEFSRRHREAHSFDEYVARLKKRLARATNRTRGRALRQRVMEELRTRYYGVVPSEIILNATDGLVRELCHRNVKK